MLARIPRISWHEYLPPKLPCSHCYSLAFGVATVAAEITAAGVFELAFALGADADHRGHDGAGDVGCAH